MQKAYDTVWCDGLWLKLWDLGEAKEFGEGPDSKVKLEGLWGRRNLRSICMAVVMTELDSCVSLGQEHMV